MKTSALIEFAEQADKNFELAVVPIEVVDKFAALIVKRCVDMIRTAQPRDTPDEIATQIEQHFGI